MAAHELPQPLGEREGQQKVRTGQQLGGLFLEPGFGLSLLAGRTMAIAAGTAHRMRASTGDAFIDDHSQLGGAAGTNRLQHLLLFLGHRRAEPLEIRPAVPPEHVGDGRHGYTISLSIAARACSCPSEVRCR
jgi:hypothetical protein